MRHGLVDAEGRMMYRTVFALSFLALGFGFLFGGLALQHPRGDASLVASIVSTVMALLGFSVGGAIRTLEHRLSQIEQQLTHRPTDPG